MSNLKPKGGLWPSPALSDAHGAVVKPCRDRIATAFHHSAICVATSAQPERSSHLAEFPLCVFGDSAIVAT